MNVNEQFQARVDELNREIAEAQAEGNDGLAEELHKELEDFCWEAEKQMGC